MYDNCIFSDLILINLTRVNAIKPNPCTISIQTLDNHPRPSTSFFHPPIIETNTPEQLHLSMHAPLTPRKSYVPGGTIVIIFILGEVFAVSWTIENWFVNHLPRKQESVALVKDLIGAGQLYRGWSKIYDIGSLLDINDAFFMARGENRVQCSSRRVEFRVGKMNIFFSRFFSLLLHLI